MGFHPKSNSEEGTSTLKGLLGIKDISVSKGLKKKPASDSTEMRETKNPPTFHEREIENPSGKWRHITECAEVNTTSSKTMRQQGRGTQNKTTSHQDGSLSKISQSRHLSTTEQAKLFENERRQILAMREKGETIVFTESSTNISDDKPVQKYHDECDDIMAQLMAGPTANAATTPPQQSKRHSDRPVLAEYVMRDALLSPEPAKSPHDLGGGLLSGGGGDFNLDYSGAPFAPLSSRKITSFELMLQSNQNAQTDRNSPNVSPFMLTTGVSDAKDADVFSSFSNYSPGGGASDLRANEWQAEAHNDGTNRNRVDAHISPAWYSRAADDCEETNMEGGKDIFSAGFDFNSSISGAVHACDLFAFYKVDLCLINRFTGC